MMDSAGRVERFRRKYERFEKEKAARQHKNKNASPPAPEAEDA
jgi:hypothetical protein